MRKIFLILFIFCAAIAFGQGSSLPKNTIRVVPILNLSKWFDNYGLPTPFVSVPGYTNISARYKWLAGAFDSALHVGLWNGVPVGVRSGVWQADGEIAMDTTTGYFYGRQGGAWIKMAKFSDVGTGYTAGYGLSLGGSVFSADSATLAAYFLRRKDSATGTNLNGYLTRSSVNTYVTPNRFGIEDNSGGTRTYAMDGGSFSWTDLSTFADTTSWKPMVVNNSTGEMRKATYWPGSGGGGSGVNGIGDLINSATAGSVLYAGTGGRLQQSNSRFYWDSTNNKLGISANGTNAFSGSYLPKSPLHIIESNTGQPRGVTIDNYNAASNAGSILLRKARGTFASPTAVQAGDAIGSIAMDGYPFNTHTAVFSGIATENYSSGHGGSMFRFELSDTGQVSPSPIVYMTGIGGGKMSILNNNPSATLDVTGYIYQTPGSFAGTTKYLHTNASNAASTTNLNPGVMIYSGAGSDWGLDLGYNSGTSRYRSRLFSNTGGDVALSYATGGPTAQSNFVDVLVVKGGTNFVGIANPDPAELLSLGTSGTTQGNIGIYGSTSGKAIITTAAAAGTPTITLPTATGTLATLAGTETFTNKRWTARVGSTTSSATPTINTDNYDIYKLTAQAADITSFTTNLSGTPVDGDILEIQITGTAARAITWGASFVASTVALPTTTVTTATLTTIFQYYTTSSYGNNKWVCVNSY